MKHFLYYEVFVPIYEVFVPRPTISRVNPHIPFKDLCKTNYLHVSVVFKVPYYPAYRRTAFKCACAYMRVRQT